MIVKILSSAKNFEGIDYSERKNDQGKSRLLKAENFGALGHQIGETKKADYINYMKLVSNANPRVKKRQFHAVLSAKEKSHSPEELATIAELYLKSMGYGENPYLIYYHGDTNNNHVHMVSTRVDKNGKKVNDSYEKIRSQKVLQQILQQDPGMETKNAIQEALRFQFSTKAQFKLLLEEQGFKTVEKENQIQLIKYGVVQGLIPIKRVEEKIAKFNPPENRIKQIRVLFHKYKKGLELEAFQEKMYQNFGLKIVLHQDKKHQRPYGYTVLDYQKKQVFKGSQIVPLKHLLLPLTKAGRKQLLIEYLNKEDLDHKTYSSLIRDLNKMGFHLNNAGDIFTAHDKNVFFMINSQDLNKMKYNSRLADAAKYSTVMDKEKMLLSKLYDINPDDLINNLIQYKKMGNYYRDLLMHGNQASSLHETIADKRLEVIQYQQDHYLLDRRNHQLYNIRRLIGDHKLDLSRVRIRNLDASGAINIEQSSNTSKALSQLAQLFDLTIAEPDRGNDQKRKKRNQRKF